jgi:hypothetical protein
MTCCTTALFYDPACTINILQIYWGSMLSGAGLNIISWSFLELFYENSDLAICLSQRLGNLVVLWQLSEITIPHYIAAAIFAAQSGLTDEFYRNSQLLAIMSCTYGLFRSWQFLWCISYAHCVWNKSMCLLTSVFFCLSMKNALELLNHRMQMSWLGLNVSLSCIRIVFMRRSNRICLVPNWAWQFTCCVWSSGIRGACFGVANQILVSSPFVFWKPICSSIPNYPWEKSCPFESWLQ